MWAFIRELREPVVLMLREKYKKQKLQVPLNLSKQMQVLLEWIGNHWQTLKKTRKTIYINYGTDFHLELLSTTCESGCDTEERGASGF